MDFKNLGEDKIAAILAADCGNATTRVALIEQQGNIYRLTAQAKVASSYGVPQNDITLGIIEAIKEIEATTGRQLLGPSGEPLFSQAEGKGVDTFAAVVSAARPLRILLAGLTERVGLAVARRAATSTYTTIVGQIALDTPRSNGRADSKISAIQQAQPDLILLVGGIDGGADTPVTTLAHTIAAALKTMPADTRPHVLYAGNTQLRATLAEIIGGLSDFKSLNNILPALDQEDLNGTRAALDAFYLQNKMKRSPGFDTLAKWTGGRVVSTARSFAQTIHYLGQSYNTNVLGVDIGSASATIAASRDSLQHHLTRADIGVGSNLPALLEQIASDNLEQWLPYETSQDDLQKFWRNKALSPQTAPQTYQEMLLELAAVREALRLMLAQASLAWQKRQTPRRKWFNWDLIVGSGQPLTQLPYPALAALALLDALEPVGVFSLALDVGGLAAMLGGIALVEPLAAAQIAGYDALLNLGTVVAPIGAGRAGETALKLKMTYQDGRELEMEIPFGALEIIALDSNEKAKLDIRAGRKFSLHPAGGALGRKMSALVRGGSLGVIIDARGRPITMPDKDADRRQQIQDWLVKLGLKPGVVED